MPTKKGRSKYMETPEIMWGHFCNYREQVKNNPKNIVEQKKGNVIIPKSFEGDLSISDLSTIKIPAERPLTMDGFANYLEDNEIMSDPKDYFENRDGRYEDYVRICSRIKRIIRQDQIEGGLIGIYNTSITQRLNNLVEKSDVTTGGEKIKNEEPIKIQIVRNTKEQLSEFNKKDE